MSFSKLHDIEVKTTVVLNIFVSFVNLFGKKKYYNCFQFYLKG